MNIALITAGGFGARMLQDIPKQFLNVNDKPVIIYTLEAFQMHPEIDVIGVVCLAGWETILTAYVRQFCITKVKYVVPGGENNQASIRNGLYELEKHFAPEDIVLIHDSNRPMVSQEIISGCIATARSEGCAIPVIPCAEAMLQTDDQRTSSVNVPRDTLKRTQTPQAFPLGRICDVERRALERGITNSIAPCTLMTEMGETVHFSVGSEKNIKLTTVEDIDIFKALLMARRADWLK